MDAVVVQINGVPVSRFGTAFVGSLLLFLHIPGCVCYAQADNDQFMNRVGLSGEDIVVDGALLDATRDPGEGLANGAGPTQNSVWWQWQAPRSALAVIRAISVDSRQLVALRVFEGSELSNLIEIPNTPQSTFLQAVFQAEEGKQYQIAAIGSLSEPVFFKLHIGIAPVNDSTPTVLNGEVFDLEGTTANASPDLDVLRESGLSTVSWEWTASASGRLWLSLIPEKAGNFQLNVFSLDGEGQWREVPGHTFSSVEYDLLVGSGRRFRFYVSSDFRSEGRFKLRMTFSRISLVVTDPGDPATGHSPVTFTLTNKPPGIEFTNLVFSFHGKGVLTNNGGSDSIIFSIPTQDEIFFSADLRDSQGRRWLGLPGYHSFGPLNDPFSLSQSLTNGQTAKVLLTGATTESGEPNPERPSVWYKWSAEVDGIASLMLTNSSRATNLSVHVFEGGILDSLIELTHGVMANRTLQLAFLTKAGTEYHFGIKAETNAEARLTMMLLAGATVPNDDLATRTILAGTNINQLVSLTMATAEPNEPALYGGKAMRTAWYSFTPSVSGEISVSVQNTITNIISRAGIYVFNNRITGQLGSGQEVIAHVSAGTEYVILIDTFARDFDLGLVNFRFHFDPAPPNDLYENRILLAPETREFGGRLPGTGVMNFSPPVVWYEWTANVTRSVPVVLLTPPAIVESRFLPRITIEVFSQTASGLGSKINTGRFDSRVAEFNAEQGKHYIFKFSRLTSFAGTDFTAAIGPPINDSFSDSKQLSGTHAKFTVNGYKASAEPGEPEGSGDSVWWTWTAPYGGWVTVSSVAPFFRVFTGTDLLDLKEVPMRRTFVPPEGEGIAFQAAAGEAYHIVADSLSGVAFPAELDLTSLRFVHPSNGEHFLSGTPIPFEIAPIDNRIDGAFNDNFFLTPFLDTRTFRSPIPSFPEFAYTNYGSGDVTFWLVATNTQGQLRISQPVSVNMEWVPPPPPPQPPNDDFANSAPFEEIFAVNPPEQVSLEGATLETGEAALEEGPPAVSRWWHWTAPFTGECEVLFLDRYSWDYFRVFTGDSISSSTVVKLDRFDRTNSLAFRFKMTQGVSYKIAIVSAWDLSVTPISYELIPVQFAQPPVLQKQLSSRAEIISGILYAGENIDHVTLMAGNWPIGISYVPPFKTIRASIPDFPASLEFRAVAVAKDGSNYWSPFVSRIQTSAPNDNFADRLTLEGESTSVKFGMINSTREPGEPTHGRPDNEGTLWWTWKAAQNGLLKISLSEGRRLAVYVGNSLEKLSILTFGDGYVVLNVTADTSYQIAVTGVSENIDVIGLREKLDLNFVANAPQLVELGPDRFSASFGEASDQGNWLQTLDLRWVSPGPGLLVLGSEDKIIISPELSYEQTLVPFLFSSAQGVYCWPVDSRSYTLSLTGFAPTVGTGIWNLRFFPKIDNDALANVETLPDAVENFPVVRYRAASLEPGEARVMPDGVTFNNLGTLWFKWTAKRSGRADLRINSDEGLLVFMGNHFDNFVSAWDRQDFVVEEGKTYYMAVPVRPDINFFNPFFAYISIHQPDVAGNDLFSNATVLSGEVARFSATNSAARREFKEPNHAGVYGGRSLWWKWVAPRSGEVRLTSMPTVFAPHEVAIYKGDSLSSLMPVVFQAFEGFGGEIQFLAEAGVEYHIAFDSARGISMESTLELRMESSREASARFVETKILPAGIQLTLQASAGSGVAIETSTDLKQWSFARELPPSPEVQTLLLPIEGISRFFRAVIR